eukprot:XP_011679740.1 PREDICTED: uncharacterized protein LOC105445649 [Strongylocentrotus purpuratus]
MAGSDVNKICKTLEYPQLLLADDLSADNVYRHLCSWKEADKMSFQGQTLRDAFERADSKEAWKDVQEQREKSDTQVSENTLAHILWHIRDPTKIDKFLHKLSLDDPDTCLDINKELKDIIKETMGYLNTWKKQHFDENPIILLSHALEKTGCSPVDRSFFKVPNELITNITEAEVQGFVDHLTIRHIKTLAQFLDIGKHGQTVNTIHEGNKDTIFNTEAMITEWIEQVECSNYEKRWRLNQAIAIIRRQDLTEQRRRVDVKIPEATLQQIILDIERHNKIEHFLRNLLPGQYIQIKDDPVEKAMKLLREWRCRYEMNIGHYE